MAREDIRNLERRSEGGGGEEGKEEGRKLSGGRRQSAAGTRGGTPPQAGAPQRMSPPYMERPQRRGGERGMSEGAGRPLAQQRGGRKWHWYGEGEGSSEPRSGDRGAQQQQARSHVRAVGVDGEVWAEPGAGMGWRHSVPRPCQPSSPAAAGRRGLWSVDTAQTTGSCSYRGHRPQPGYANPPKWLTHEE